MAIRGAQTHLTPEEYIALERKAIPDVETVRSEYINGKVIKMPGASFPHNLITSNRVNFPEAAATESSL